KSWYDAAARRRTDGDKTGRSARYSSTDIFSLGSSFSFSGRSIVPKAICWQMAQRPLEYPENQGWQLQQCWALTSTSLKAGGYESCEFLARPPDSPRFPARERGIRARLGGLSSAAGRASVLRRCHLIHSRRGIGTERGFASARTTAQTRAAST